MNKDEEIALEALTEFLNACEAGFQAAKQRIKEAKCVNNKPSWDPSRINWVEAEGAKGKYERSEDVNSPDFKALMKDLEAHSGKLTRDGYFFWKFTKSAVIARKKRK